MAELVLVTGPVRSGKSNYAAELAERYAGPVVLVATCPRDIDEEMSRRIQAHQDRRPAHWRTIEETTHVAGLLKRLAHPEQVVIVDCLTLLVSNLLLQGCAGEAIAEEIDAMITHALSYNRATIIVSNEVGWGVVPASAAGRAFRDAVGRAHQAIAARASRVWLLVCGIPQELKGTGGSTKR